MDVFETGRFLLPIYVFDKRRNNEKQMDRPIITNILKVLSIKGFMYLILSSFSLAIYPASFVRSSIA